MAQISAAVWIYANNDKLGELLRYTVKTTVQSEYSVIESRTETFDAIQSGVSTNLLGILIYNFLIKTSSSMWVTINLLPFQSLKIALSFFHEKYYSNFKFLLFLCIKFQYISF